MDQILLGLGAAGAALLIIAIGVAVWEQRRHKAEMRMQQVWSEDTREQLQAYARDVDARLAALAAEVHAQRAAAHSPGRTAVTASSDGAAGSAAALPSQGASRSVPAAIGPDAAKAGIAATAGAAAQVAVSQQWVETEPMVLTSQVLTPDAHWPRMPDFDPTMPAELSEH